MTYSQGLKSEKVQTGVQWNGSRPSWHTYPRKQSWTCSFSRSAVFGSLQSWWLCSPPGSSVHGILQARILVRVAMSSSRGSSQPRDRTSISYVPALAGGFFTANATWEALQQIQANANTESISTSPFNTKGLFYPQQCFFASLICFCFFFYSSYIFALRDWLWWVPLPQTLFPDSHQNPFALLLCPKVTSQPWFPWPPYFKHHSHILNLLFYFLMTVITL